MAYVTRREFETLLPLVVASFPPVFNSYMAGGKRQRREGAYLARSIVRLFVRHDWDGTQFLQLVMSTADEAAMFDAVKDSWGGLDYLRHAFQTNGILTNADRADRLLRLTHQSSDLERIMKA